MLRKLRPLIVAPLAAIIALAGAPGASADSVEDMCLNKELGYICSTNGDVTVGITKVLQVPIGTKLPIGPGLKFNFTVRPVSVDGIDYIPVSETEPGNMPEFTMTNNLMVTTDDQFNGDGGTYLISDIAVSPKTVTTYTYNLQNILPEAADFKHAGVFVYEITEDSDTNALTSNEKLTYSSATYTLTVYVMNGDDDQATNTPVIYAASVRMDSEDIDEYSVADPGFKAVKVDASPGDSKDPSGLVFTSRYIKTNTPTNGNPALGNTLAVSTNVTGILASHDQLFNFTMSVTTSALDDLLPNYEAPTSYKAYVMRGNSVEPQDDNNTFQDPDTFGPYLMISADATNPTSFSLLPGQSLVFVDTPVGTAYTVTEINPAGYIPSVIVTTDDSAALEKLGTLSADLSSNLESGTAPIIETPQLVGDGVNIAAFSNERSFITPTGLTMGSLPFVGLVAVALIALVVVVAVKYSGRKVAGANS